MKLFDWFGFKDKQRIGIDRIKQYSYINKNDKTYM